MALITLFFFISNQVEAEKKWTAFPGGAPANVATALTKLGTSSAFAGCLGTDDYGDHLQSILTDVRLFHAEPAKLN